MDFVITVICVGTHINKEEDDQSDHISHRYIPWEKGGKIRWQLNLQNFESDTSYRETYSVMNRKPMQIRKNRCDATKMNFNQSINLDISNVQAN